MTGTVSILIGALVATSLIASVQFLKFWRLTKDRFFVWFALAFAIFATSYVVRAVTDDVTEHTYYVYVPRLLGFLLILFAIFDKNRRSKT
jgi:hypothetical protein